MKQTLLPNDAAGGSVTQKWTKARQLRTWLIRAAVVLVIGVVAAFAWQRYAAKGQDQGIASGNGRIEGTEIDIATKSSGRISAILVNEGEFVTAGQVVARMDTATLVAQLHQAQAEFRQAESRVATARSQIARRESEKAAAEATVAQHEVERNNAKAQLDRSVALVRQGFTSEKAVDDDRARLDSAEATIRAARAQVAAAQAAIVSARSEVVGEQSSAAAAQATIERIQAEINDSELRSPRDGRVQYLVARVGEVVGAGGRVLNLVDLSDVYMTFFLPTASAGKVALGAEVRLVLDALPQIVIPARVSYVADVAQFTPKTVETASEREKLMFRIKAQIAPDLLRKHITQVKTGLPGMAYVRLDASAEWPARLQAQLPQ
jgi:HlyD family secretion protein